MLFDNLLSWNGAFELDGVPEHLALPQGHPVKFLWLRVNTAARATLAQAPEFPDATVNQFLVALKQMLGLEKPFFHCIRRDHTTGDIELVIYSQTLERDGPIIRQLVVTQGVDIFRVTLAGNPRHPNRVPFQPQSYPL